MLNYKGLKEGIAAIVTYITIFVLLVRKGLKVLEIGPDLVKVIFTKPFRLKRSPFIQVTFSVGKVVMVNFNSPFLNRPISKAFKLLKV